jgi:sugar/nucleoside kinase (ribokinase family)
MKVIGIGDNVVDKYLHQNKMYPGGNALNFSVFAKKLGVGSSYMGVFGTDEAAQHIKDVLNQLNIDISHSRTYEGKNGFAEVNLEDGDRVFVGSNGGGVSKKYPLKLNQEDLSFIKEHELIHSSCFSFIEDELFKLKNLHIPVSYDFSKNHSKKYLNKVCLNINYAFLSCGHLNKNETKDKLKLVIDNGCKLAVATRGIKGAILLYKNKFYSQKANRVEPLDTLGAGDSFITALLLEFLKSPNITEEVISRGLKKAAKYSSSKTCLTNGAFGYGKKIN